MPLVDGKYVSPVWQDGQSPAIDAIELNALTKTVAVNGAQTLNKQLLALILGATDGGEAFDTDLIPVAPGDGTEESYKISVGMLLAHIKQSLPYATIQTGSYVGTGTYGAANPVSIRLQYTPRLIVVFPAAPAVQPYNVNNIATFMGDWSTNCHLAWIPGVEMYQTQAASTTTQYPDAIMYPKYNNSTKTFSWAAYYPSGGNARSQLNVSGLKYAWLAICERT